MGKPMIIIIGSSSGLGKKITEMLLNYDKIIFTHFKNELIFIDQNVKSQYLDLTNFESIDNFIQNNKSILKNLTLVNLSAYSKDGLFYDYDYFDWKNTFDINVNGPFYLIKKLLPFMISNKFGRIINISSYLANNGAIGASAYSSSKSALIGLTKTLSKEYGRFNILTNIIELGYFNIGLIDRFEEKTLNKLKKKIPTNSFGEPLEIVNMIQLLISSKYVNGAQIKINGGL